MQFTRKLIIYGDYFVKFYKSRDQKTQQKIEFVLDILRFEQKIPEKFFKHLKGSGGLYEIRILTQQGNIRIISFFDKGNLIILMNCFMKKGKKVPLQEIKLAQKLKQEYLNENYSE